MKRTAFKSRGKPLARTGELKRSGGIAQKAPLKTIKGFPAPSARKTGQIAPSAKKSGSTPNIDHSRRPKTKKAKQKTPKWMKKHLQAVKQCPCIICHANWISDAHHCFHDRHTRYGGRKAPHLETIPLCKTCHTDGPEAIHRIKTSWREKHGPDWSFVAPTITRIYGRPMTPDQIKDYWKEAV